MRLLVPSVGRKRYLCHRLTSLLADRGGELLGSDLDERAPALACVDRRVDLPRSDADEYWQAVKRVIDEERIDAVLPVRQEELLAWAECREVLPMGLAIKVSAPETLRICGDKARLYRLVSSLGLECPRWQRLPATGEWGVEFSGPMVVKPIHGSGSRGVKKLTRAQAFDHASSDSNTPYLVQEYVEGAEYSADCYVDESGDLVACCVRERLEVEAGECVSARVVERYDLERICEVLAARLVFSGPFNAQFVDDAGTPKLIDLNPRFPGGIRFTEEAGYPYVAWWVAELYGESLKRP